MTPHPFPVGARVQLLNAYAGGPRAYLGIVTGREHRSDGEPLAFVRWDEDGQERPLLVRAAILGPVHGEGARRPGALYPIAPTPSWLAAVDAAEWQCQCTTGAERVTACGRSHRSQDRGRCQQRGDGPTAGHLILTDGRVYCEPCAAGRERTTRRRAAAAPETPGQVGLF